MFGSNSKEDFEKLITKGKWDKLGKKLKSASEEERVNIADACSVKVCDETSNILIDFLKDSSDQVKMAAMRSLQKVGNDHAVTQLQWLLGTLTPDQKEMHEIVQHTIETLRGKR